MSALITLDSLSLTTPDAETLFAGLSLTIGRERIGLVGRNGCGKSTLLKLIASDKPPASGSVSRFAACGLLEQSMPVHGRRLVDGLGVGDAFDRVQRITRGEALEDDLDKADWTLESRIEAALEAVGLPMLDPERALEASSGGQRTRIALAALLIDEPELLLLDEPTNNLDQEGRALIFDLIERWGGGMIVASHDRDLLEHMDRIVELAPSGCEVFTGGWSAYEADREARRERIASALDKAQSAFSQAKRDVQQRAERKARSDKQGRSARKDGSQSKLILNAMREMAQGTDARANAASARQLSTAQSELDTARAKLERVTPLAIDLPASGVGSGQRVLAFHAVNYARGERQILAGVDLEIKGPERLLLRGSNGSGKSTLLGLAAGRITPDSGAIERREGGVVMLDQHADLLAPQDSVLGNIRRLNPHLSDNAARAHLARFAFRNRAAEKPAGVLSGGERLRAGLAAISAGAQAPSLLILDEPTNHLDLESIDILEAALAGFDGALMLASHDPAFCRRIGITREIVIDGFRVGRTKGGAL